MSIASVATKRKSKITLSDEVHAKVFAHYNTAFTSGFAGAGGRWDYGITEAGKSTIIVDNVTARQKFKVYELEVSKIKNINGGLLITPGSAIVDGAATLESGTLGLDGSSYIIPVDSESGHSLDVGDLIRAQKIVAGTELYLVKMEVTAVTASSFTATLDGDNTYIDSLEKFDRMEFSSYGNTSNTLRQGGLYLTSTDDNAPFLDVFDDVSSPSFFNTPEVVKGRFGDLSGYNLPGIGNLSGYGVATQRFFATNDTHIQGTLTVGDADGFGSTFYAGRVNRNITPNSDKGDLWQAPWNTSTETLEPGYVPSGEYDEVRRITWNGADASTMYFYIRPYNSVDGYIPKEEVNTVFTLSFYMRANRTLTIPAVRTYNGSNYYTITQFLVDNVITTEWKRIIIKGFTHGQPDYDVGIIMQTVLDTGDYIEFRDCQLEKGSYPTMYQKTDGVVGDELGSELIVNGGFSLWTGDDPDGWIVTGEDGVSNYVDRDGTNNAVHLVSDGTNVRITQGGILTVGKTYQYKINVTSITGSIYLQNLGGETILYISTPGIYIGEFVAKADVFVVSRASSCDAIFTDVSVKEVLPPSYAVWMTSGGIGGTIQNPIARFNDYGMFIRNNETGSLSGNHGVQIGAEVASWGNGLPLTWNNATAANFGVYGYSSGNEIFALRADGTASIAGWSFTDTELTGTNARLRSSGILSLGSGDGWAVANSIYIDGASSRMSIGSGFKYSGGSLVIDGSATIGGWNISANTINNGLLRLYADSTVAEISTSPGHYNNADTPFYLAYSITSGVTYFSLSDKLNFNTSNNVLYINGDITATSGNIGGWSIQSESLESGSTGGTNNYALRLHSGASWTNGAIGSDYNSTQTKARGLQLFFRVPTYAGNMIFGNLMTDASGNTVQNGFDDFYGLQFQNEGGIPYERFILGVNITSGVVVSRIAGWNFDWNYLWSGTKQTSDGYSTSGITLNSAGAIYSPKFYLGIDGSAHFKGSLEAASGTFAGSVTALSGTITGTLLVGSSGVVIDGASKLIKSSNYVAGSTGWQIANSGAAEFNNVTIRGTVYASAGSFTGSVTATSGSIGGWTIQSESLESGSTGGTNNYALRLHSGASWTNGAIGSDYNSTQTKARGLQLFFRVPTYAGNMIFGNLMTDASGNTVQNGFDDFYGLQFQNGGGSPYERFILGVNITSGVVVSRIAGWNFDWNYLWSGTKQTSDGYSTSGVTLNSAGAIYSPKFYLGTDGSAHFKGNLEAASGTFAGSVTALSGTITGTLLVGSSGVVIDGASKLIKSSNYIAGSTGWQIANSGVAEFNNVTIRGTVYASAGSFTGSVTTTSGNIGGWTINTNSIYAVTETTSGYATSGLTLYSGGSLHAKEFYIDTSGGAHFKGAIEGGSISIGSNFSVDSAGNVIASSLKSSPSGEYMELTSSQFSYNFPGSGAYIYIGGGVLGGYAGIWIKEDGGGLKVSKTDGSNVFSFDPFANLLSLPSAKIQNNYIRKSYFSVGGTSTSREISITAKDYDNTALLSEKETMITVWISATDKGGLTTLENAITVNNGYALNGTNIARILIFNSDSTGLVKFTISGNALGTDTTYYVMAVINGVVYSQSFTLKV